LELLRINEDAWLLPGRTCLGIIQSQGQALLVDSGNGPDSAKKALRAIEGAGWRLAGILNTHAHADHYGGNGVLTRKTQAPVFASELEALVMKYPVLEPTALFGAYPPPNLKNGFLMAAASPVDRLVAPGETLRVGERVCQAVSLSGHSMGQVGLACGEILFAGDAFIGQATLERNPIPYNVDTKRALESLDLMETAGYHRIVASHTQPEEDHRRALRLYRQRILQVADSLLSFLKSGPSTTESLLGAVCDRYGSPLKAPTQYYLMRSAIASILSYLREKGEIAMSCTRGEMFWHTHVRI
jgi:glyoxylase-like metal-dependent hydrolase (beta-lactamase superfamily II)